MMKTEKAKSWTAIPLLLACLGAVSLVAACGGGGGGEDEDADADAGDADGTEDGADVPEICQGLDLCDAAGLSCDGNTLVTCAENADGCLVETREDCTEVENGFCDDAADPPECGTMDPCEGIEQCAAESRVCEADVLVVCSPDANACLVESRVDCTESDGGFCNEDLDPPACDVDLDPCVDVPNPCDTEGRSCDGDVLAVCALDAYGCLVETRTDCTDSDFVCNPDSDPVACAAPCTLVELCPEPVFCDGAVLVTCADDAHGCLVRETEVDCAADGMICDPTLDPPECVEGSCMEAMRINCSSGTVNADTADTDPTSPPYATTRLTSYSCETYSYPGNEFIFMFTETVDSNVVITSTRLASSGDFDLYALDGAGAECAEETLDCLDSSVGTTATEVVEFHAAADQPVFVVYDIFNDASATTAFTLDIHCITCGDGSVEEPEQCDDGDTDDGDGCSSGCQVESGWVCDDSEPSVCRETVCGDGTVEGSEACDDGDTDDGDGCSSSCAVETGWLCDDSEPSVCHEVICGDGAIEGVEECDDNNTASGDGCSPACVVESGWFCTGEPSVCWSGGDTCADPVRITSGTYEFDTTPYTADYTGYLGDCSSTGYTAAGPDMVLAVEVPDGSVLNVTMDGLPSWDEVVVIASECPDTIGSCRALADYSDEMPAQVVNTSGSVAVYYIVADGYFSSSYGPFSLEVDVVAIVCGDGIVIGSEECDDNNTTSGDGCSASCTVESGWYCGGEPSFCWSGGDTCADPVRITSGTYEFDTTPYTADYTGYLGDCSSTGYTAAGPDMVLAVEVPDGSVLNVTMDGLPSWDEVVVIASECPDTVGSCRALADYDYEMPAQVVNTSGSDAVYYIVADGYSSGSYGPFSLEVDVVAMVCGDGIVIGAEECDDNNLTAGDGCSPTCTIESGWHCGGEPSFCWEGGATCSDPVRVTAGSYVFSTEGYANDYDDYMGDCSATGYQAAGPDMVLAVSVPSGLTLSVTMDGLPLWDEVVVIASECPDIVGSCRSLADYSDEMPAQVTNASGSDATYYIVADGYYSYSVGEFSLDITVE